LSPDISIEDFLMAGVASPITSELAAVSRGSDDLGCKLLSQSLRQHG
jgi:hypothetical protein